MIENVQPPTIHWCSRFRPLPPAISPVKRLSIANATLCSFLSPSPLSLRVRRRTCNEPHAVRALIGCNEKKHLFVGWSLRESATRILLHFFSIRPDSANVFALRESRLRAPPHDVCSLALFSWFSLCVVLCVPLVFFLVN